MLNNNPNPLRAAYPELGNRTAIEAMQNPAIAGAAAGLPVFTGPGGVAEVKTAAEALQAMGLAYETGVWTPRWEGSETKGDFTYGQQRGSYSRFGDRVYLDFVVSLSTIVSAPAGGMYIYGLPFAFRVSKPYYVGQLMIHANTAGLAIGESLGCGITSQGSLSIQFWISRPNARYALFTAANITDKTEVYGSISYDCE